MTLRLLTATACLAVLTAAATRAAPRPNILFIMSDDHTSQAIGAYGGRLAKLDVTPTLDRLAREGVVFENAFCVNSICTPSRAAIMTGQYPHKNGVYDLGGRLESERQYLALEMGKAGYHTAMIGKWHLKEEPGAFDYYCVLPGQGKYFSPEFRVQGEKPWPRNTVKFPGKHSTDTITDLTLTWFREGWDRQKPFFVMHHYKAPHDLFQHAERYNDTLADVQIPEPANLWEQPTFGSIATRGHKDELLPYIGTSIGRRNVRRNYVKKWAKDPDLTDEQAKRQAYNEYMRRYLRCVKGIDDNLARLFAYLKAEGLMDSTVIIYTGDQGFMLGEHDYMDKRWMYEESMRMPFIVRYPETIPAGTRTDVIVENVDYGPTMLDFAGIETPAVMQGRSFRQVCETGAAPPDWKQAAYYRYWMHMAHHDNPGHLGIRTREFKLIYYYGCGRNVGQRTPPGWELYDLRNDPTEVVNQYDNPGYASVVAKLKRELAALRRRVGDTGEDYPAVEAILQEFWDYDEADRKAAVEISQAYLQSKQKPAARSSAPARRTKSGWILPAESDAPLRTLDGAAEISRDAAYRIHAPGNAGFNVDNAHLLSGAPPRVKQHAFHSADADSPHVVIKLSVRSRVSHVRIVNRASDSEALLARAKGLVLRVSEDGEAWERAWQAGSVAKAWDITLQKPTVCRFLKIGLERKGTLHLNQVVVFGERL